MFSKTLHISTSPHIAQGRSTDMIMRHVVYALLPAASFSVYVFGINALLVIAAAVVSAVVAEHYLCIWSKKESTITDWSAVITGLLLGLTLPPTFPMWMAAIGGVVSIGIGKFVFGGLGYNAFNPALVGRAFLQAAFPVAITTWHTAMMPERFTGIASSVMALPFAEPVYDGLTGATPLAAFKFDKVTASASDLLWGFTSGSAGETSALFILIGGAYLIARKMMNWRIPVAILTTVAFFTGILYLLDPVNYPSPVFMLFSGGLMLGAVFMATDMVGSPITSLGVVIYGIFIGALVVVIRIWGGLPEGVMYAILLGNALSLHIDKLIIPKVYGTKIKKP